MSVGTDWKEKEQRSTGGGGVVGLERSEWSRSAISSHVLIVSGSFGGVMVGVHSIHLGFLVGADLDDSSIVLISISTSGSVSVLRFIEWRIEELKETIWWS